MCAALSIVRRKCNSISPHVGRASFGVPVRQGAAHALTRMGQAHTSTHAETLGAPHRGRSRAGSRLPHRQGGPRTRRPMGRVRKREPRACPWGRHTLGSFALGTVWSAGGHCEHNLSKEHHTTTIVLLFARALCGHRKSTRCREVPFSRAP